MLAPFPAMRILRLWSEINSGCVSRCNVSHNSLIHLIPLAYRNKILHTPLSNRVHIECPISLGQETRSGFRNNWLLTAGSLSCALELSLIFIGWLIPTQFRLSHCKRTFQFFCRAPLSWEKLSSRGDSSPSRSAHIYVAINALLGCQHSLYRP